MAKARSPNYPQISLRKALDLAHKVYASAHTNKAPPEAVAKELGYNSLNGASLGVLSALKKYGLLESVGDEVRISQEGLSILVDPPGSAARANAIIRAAFRPALFAELRKEYGDTPPKSDEYLRAFLLKRGFVQGVVDTPIRTYRDTMTLVEQARADLQEAGALDDDGTGAESGEEEQNMEAATSEAVKPAKAAAAMSASSSDDVVDDVYKLADGRAFVLRWPAKLTSDEYEDFEAWITLLQRKLKRQIEQ